jgi:predicted transport protein
VVSLDKLVPDKPTLLGFFAGLEINGVGVVSSEDGLHPRVFRRTTSRAEVCSTRLTVQPALSLVVAKPTTRSPLEQQIGDARMSDIKLFSLSAGDTTELPSRSAQIEKSLQTLFETNLEALLGVRLLASEYSTGKVHGGRIDTLGIDENGCPVIIEYKRAVNENVINQGLFYLDWLLDHRKEFQWLVMEALGADTAKAVEWSAPRLLCIAGDFTNYDQHAVKQINRNIELIRYRRYGDDLLLLELVNATTASSTANTAGAPEPATKIQSGKPSAIPYQSQGVGYRFAQASQPIKDLFEALKAFLLGLGDDVQAKQLQNYFAFKRIKNFACVEVYPQVGKVMVFLKVDPKTVLHIEGFSRDVSNIGHYGTGDLELTLRTMDDLTRAQPLIVRSYEGS